MKIKISNILKERLININNKVSNFILANLNPPDNCLKRKRPQYLDFDGNLVTYINSNKNKENPWTCNTRQGTKAVRVLRKIFTNEFIDRNLKQRDIEEFVSSWTASQNNTARIVEYKGWDILKAFNYNDEIDLKKFSSSCANFKQHKGPSHWDEPMIKWFYFYIFNENISVPCVIEDGIIKARSVLFTGKQIEDSGDFKKGETYTFLNGFYSEGSEKYRHILMNWGKERGYYDKNGAILMDMDTKTNLNGHFKFYGFKLHYKTFPPVDGIFAFIDQDDYDKSYITSRMGYDDVEQKNLVSLYKLRQNGGEHLIKNRKVEDNEMIEN